MAPDSPAPSVDAPSLSDAFWFIIPLRAKAVSKDWARVCSLLRDTVRSALNQTDPDFHILIACQDSPDLSGIDDPRVIVLRGDFPLPATLLEQTYDKRAKRRLAAGEIRRRGGGYFMLLDSDDFVSRHIVEHARKTQSRDGYYVPKGHEYYAEDGVIRPLDNFHRLCGSCFILRFAPDDLPAGVDDPAVTALDRFTNHRLVLETATELGLHLDPVPFPAAVYLRENGENHSVQVQAQRRFSRHKIRLFLDRIARRIGLAKGRLSPEDQQEFSLPAPRRT